MFSLPKYLPNSVTRWYRVLNENHFQLFVYIYFSINFTKFFLFSLIDGRWISFRPWRCQMYFRSPISQSPFRRNLNFSTINSHPLAFFHQIKISYIVTCFDVGCNWELSIWLITLYHYLSTECLTHPPPSRLYYLCAVF